MAIDLDVPGGGPGDAGDAASHGAHIEYTSEDFHASSKLKKFVHGCMFANIGGPKYEFALANYCYAFFAKHKLEVSTEKAWYDFFFDDATGLNGVSGQGSIETCRNMISGDEPVDTSLAALVVYALTKDKNVVTQGHTLGTFESVLVTSYSSTIKVAPGDLYRSLLLEHMNAQPADNPFKVFCYFVANVLDDTVARTEQMTGGGSNFFYTTSDGSKVTRSGGLDARAFVFMCFKLFKKVFATGSENGGSADPTEPILAGVDGAVNYSTLGEIADNGYGADGASLNYEFEFFIPKTFYKRKNNANDACNADPPNSSFTAFSDARNDVDMQLKRFGAGLCHLGAIRRSIKNARTDIGTVTVGTGAEDIIKEFLPSATESETGKVMFSRFGTGHLTTIAKNLERTMPFTGKDAGTDTSQLALLPYSQKISPPANNPIGGRYQTMVRFLANSQNLTFSEDNLFDPSNAKIACIGIPTGGVEAMHLPSVQLNNSTIENGTNEVNVGDNYSRDDSLLRISVTKTDALLPTVQFHDVSFYYDPRLYVAAGGFNDCASDKLEDDLESIKFKRAVVNNSGKVEIVDVDFSVDTGFSEGAGSISLLEPGIAAQLAYMTASSDLLAFYLSVVCGMELEERAFGIEDSLLDQGIDSEIMPNVGDFDLATVDSKTLLASMPGLEISVPFSSDTISSMIGNAKQLGNYETSRVLDMAHVDPTLELNPSDVLSTRQILSSLFFKPLTARSDVLFPRRFEGVVFCYLDPDAFKVSDFGNQNAEDVLKEQNVALEFPEGSDEYYIIKSGNNEDASSVIGLNVMAEAIIPGIGDLADSPINDVMFGFDGGEL